MSAIADYINMSYTSSESGPSPVGTYGGLDTSTLFGSKGGSDVGLRLPSASSSEGGVNIDTGVNTDFNFGDFATSSPYTYSTQGAQPTTARPKFDLASTLSSGVELFQKFQKNRQSVQIDGSANVGDVVKGDVLGTARGTMDGGQTAGTYAAAGEAAALIGTGVEMAFDDEDATKWNAGEISGSLLKGAGKGAATGASVGAAVGTIVPGVGNVIGAGVGAVAGAIVGVGANLIGGITGRNKARKKAIKEAKEKRKQIIKQGTSFAQKQSVGMTQAAADMRSASAAAGLEEAQEKYKLSHGGKIFSDEYLEFRKNKKMYNNGGRIVKLAIQNNRKNRPEHLKYEGLMGELKLFDLYNKQVTPIKKPVYNTDYSEINQNLEKGGMIEYEAGGSHGGVHSATGHSKRPEALKYEYNDGGVTLAMLEPSPNEYQAPPQTGALTTQEGVKVGVKQGVKHGVKTGIKVGATRLAGHGLLNAAATRVGTKFIPGVGQAWLAADVGYYGTKFLTQQYAKGHNEAFGPALNELEQTHGKETRNKIEQTTHAYGVPGVGSGYSAKFNKGGKISYDVEDYLTDNYKNFIKGGMVEEYKTGGMTQGEFSHDNNPLTVVDKNGQDTGMELTGGEGVFDQKAMTMLDKYKQNKDYSKAGKLVFNEMDSWVDAGTAEHGARLKEYYG